LNFNGNDLVCLEDEYGIFGGAAGAANLGLEAVNTASAQTNQSGSYSRER
jgi:hypothetical protein